RALARREPRARALADASRAPARLTESPATPHRPRPDARRSALIARRCPTLRPARTLFRIETRRARPPAEVEVPRAAERHVGSRAASHRPNPDARRSVRVPTG